ncbi:hypothetical protein QQS45_00030 [Alteriqipengyuania flavescens]|uniref:phage tail terminator protein n=1 Tax=Alteriqipengyuania flavescens TaxID=3053610 RepID=UPI0025B32B68|nr:hypothetical protein [Alteriqipengyuania flavescens]WJY18677.1 hypothetical protein QQW98_00030 [Alteriqipengyuania flavescens]WJY24617.1 hypothetical protein QQS45_00030 [Alteriqipengyuania flavescens]
MIASQPIADRLREAGCEHVSGLFEFAQLKSPPRALPAHFVIPENERAQGSQRVGAYDQKLTFAFSVVIVMKPAGRAGHAAVDEQLHDEIARVKDALFGWQHPEAASGCFLAGGRLLDIDASALSWAVEFTTHYRERKV